MAMFISIYNILPSLQSLPSILLLSIILILTWKWSKKRENFKGEGRVIPPGSLGLPLVGETMNLISAYKTEHPDPFIDDRVKLHGSKLFTSHIFGERTIFSTDPDFNRVVLRGEGRIFEASYPSSITTLLGRHSLSIIKGAPHKRMHALTMGWFSSVSVLRNSLLPEIESLVRNVLCSWKEGEVLLLLDQTKKITFDLTVKQLVSHDPGEWTETLRSEYLRLINGFFSIPFPSFLSFTTYGRAIQARKKVAGMLREVVRKRKDERSKREVNNDDNDQMDYNNDWQNIKRRTSDILDELIEAEEGYTEEEMVDFLLSLLVAGYETTPTIMTLVVKFLTETPPALSLLKEEHEEIKARKKKSDNEHLEWSDYKAMPFTQCVINETLRVVNIVSGVFRRATTDVHFKGYTIPEGCKVFASFRAVHLDQEYFEDARSFNPFRWQNSKESGLFTPFGGGPRLCPGYELARVEISVFLHHLITRFSWDVVEQDRLVFFPTTRLLKGYPIIVHQKEH